MYDDQLSEPRLPALYTPAEPWSYAPGGLPASPAMAALVIVANPSTVAFFRGTVVGYFPDHSVAFVIKAEHSSRAGGSVSHLADIGCCCCTVFVQPKTQGWPVAFDQRLVESHVLLQLGDMRDVGALQPSTLHICPVTFFGDPIFGVPAAVSKSVAEGIDHVAVVPVSGRWAEDLLALHRTVCAVPLKAVALLGARGSVLDVGVIGASVVCTQAVLRKVTDVHDGSAGGACRGVHALLTAGAHLTLTSRRESALARTALVKGTFFERATVTFLPSAHYAVSAAILCQGSVRVSHDAAEHALAVGVMKEGPHVCKGAVTEGIRHLRVPVHEAGASSLTNTLWGVIIQTDDSAQVISGCDRKQ